MMRTVLTFMFSFSILFGAYCQTAKVIGYLPSYRFSLVEQIEFCKLTHVNISFANPDAEGYLIIDEIGGVVDHIREENPDIKIFISLAGGALSSEQAAAWSSLIDIPNNRPAFVEKILAYIDQYKLDGVDVDLEWSHVTEGYSGFVIELAEAIHAADLLITAALPASYRYPQISDEAIDAYDWINLMAYDLTGPWDPSNDGPHSPYYFARSGIDYWKAFDISGDKLTLGVPFYGYEFSPGGVSAFTYGSMVNMDTLNAYVDQVGDAYYNGIPTIQDKVQLAADEVSGTMIWEIGQDHYSQFSLLTAIDAKYKELGIQTTSSNCGIVSSDDIVGVEKFNIYPNPSHDVLQIDASDNIQSIGLFSLDGKLLMFVDQIYSNESNVPLHNIPTGIYVLKAKVANQIITRKMVVR